MEVFQQRSRGFVIREILILQSVRFICNSYRSVPVFYGSVR